MAIDYNKRPEKADSAAPAPAGGGGGVSLSKVTLTKSAPSVSLTKQGGSAGRPAAGQPAVELRCGGETRGCSAGAPRPAGSTSTSPACGSSPTAARAWSRRWATPSRRYRGAPIIRLDGDDRSGSAVGGENMFIDLSRLNEIRRILVFTFIYEGVPNWASADGVVTLYPATSADRGQAGRVRHRLAHLRDRASREPWRRARGAARGALHPRRPGRRRPRVRLGHGVDTR